jgi:hypothetical protein
LGAEIESLEGSKIGCFESFWGAKIERLEIGQNWGLQGLQDAIQDGTSNCKNFKHETTWQNGEN